MERYRSGHNEAVLKTVCPKGRVGSNPTLSVGIQFYIVYQFGEVPKLAEGTPLERVQVVNSGARVQIPPSPLCGSPAFDGLFFVSDKPKPHRNACIPVSQLSRFCFDARWHNCPITHADVYFIASAWVIFRGGPMRETR